MIRGLLKLCSFLGFLGRIRHDEAVHASFWIALEGSCWGCSDFPNKFLRGNLTSGSRLAELCAQQTWARYD